MVNTNGCFSNFQNTRLIQWVNKKVVAPISGNICALRQSCQWYFEKRKIRKPVKIVSCSSRMRDPDFFDECFLCIINAAKKSIAREDEVFLMELLNTLSGNSEHISTKNRAGINELAIAAATHFEQKEDYTMMIKCMNHTMRLCSVSTTHSLAKKSIIAATRAFDRKDTFSAVPLLMSGIYGGSERTKILSVLCLCHLAYTSNDTQVINEALSNAYYYASLVQGLEDLTKKIKAYRFDSGPNPMETHAFLIDASRFIFENLNSTPKLDGALRFLRVDKRIIKDIENEDVDLGDDVDTIPKATFSFSDTLVQLRPVNSKAPGLAFRVLTAIRNVVKPDSKRSEKPVRPVRPRLHIVVTKKNF